MIDTEEKITGDGGDEDDSSEKAANSPFRVYIVATHIAWLVISPLILFIWGGSWLVGRFGLPQWLMIVFVFLGLIMMVAGVASYMKQLLRMYYGPKSGIEKRRSEQLKPDKRDYDYNDDNYRIK